jgi:hypothetical protein
MEGRCSLYIEFGLKGQRSSALDIFKVEIWFPGSRVTPYITYMDYPWDVRYPRFYQALSLSTQERGNLYLLTHFKSIGCVGVS